MSDYIVGPSISSAPAGYDGFFNTLTSAESGVTNGDTVDVQASTYDELFTVLKQITWTALDKTDGGTVVDDTDGPYPIIIRSANASTVDGFTIQGRASGASDRAVYFLNDAQNKILQNCFVSSDGDDLVWVRSGSSDISILNNSFTFSGTKTAPIKLESSPIVFTGNTITSLGVSTQLVKVTMPGGDLTFSNNTLTLNTSDTRPISIANPSSLMTNLTLSSNTITHNKNDQYGFELGNEATGANDGNLNGVVVTDNKIFGRLFYDNSVTGVTTHGIFIGHNINPTVLRNKSYGSGYLVVYKGTSQTDTGGKIDYNLCVEFGVNAVRIKGIAAAKLRHNTLYGSVSDVGASISVSNNDGVGAGSITDFRNNVVVNLNTQALISLGSGGSMTTCNYNLYMSDIAITGSPFVDTPNGGGKTWKDWVALGHDANSYYVHKNGSDYDWYHGSTPTALVKTTSYPAVRSDGKLSKDNLLSGTGVSISGVNDGGETDPWGKHTNSTRPNIGADQSNLSTGRIGNGFNKFKIQAGF